jgi:hypothetical protein
MADAGRFLAYGFSGAIQGLLLMGGTTAATAATDWERCTSVAARLVAGGFETTAFRTTAGTAAPLADVVVEAFITAVAAVVVVVTNNAASNVACLLAAPAPVFTGLGAFAKGLGMGMPRTKSAICFRVTLSSLHMTQRSHGA